MLAHAPTASTSRTVEVGARSELAPQRLPSLTSLRFFAALLVFGRHAEGILDRAGLDQLGNYALHQGGAGVSFFFILSGFVLAWSRPAGDSAMAFYRRRFARIYPLHALTWAIALAASLVVLGDRSDALQSVASLLLLQSFIPDDQYYFAVNGVAWSLSGEAFFYALFPVLALALARLKRRRLPIAMGLLVVGIVLVGLAPVIFGSSPTGTWFVKIFPGTRILEFVLGILIAIAVREGFRPRIGLGAAVALAVVGYLAAGVAPGTLRWAATTAAPFALLIAVAAVGDVRGKPSVLHRRPLILLGEWSFAFYLTHQMVIRMAEEFLPARLSVPEALVATGLCLAIAVAVARCLFRWVERPLERRLRGQPRPLPLERSGPA